jgi:hypothetical protein
MRLTGLAVEGLGTYAALPCVAPGSLELRTRMRVDIVDIGGHGG